jgi:hypothetical protein
MVQNVWLLEQQQIVSILAVHQLVATPLWSEVAGNIQDQLGVICFRISKQAAAPAEICQAPTLGEERLVWRENRATMCASYPTCKSASLAAMFLIATP